MVFSAQSAARIVVLSMVNLVMYSGIGLYGQGPGSLPVIKNVTVTGNKHIKTDAILNRLPYKKGGVFDAEKSVDAINNVYMLGYFDQVVIEKEQLDTRTVDLFVTLQERKLLEKIDFEGNKAFRAKEFFEKFQLEKIETIDQEQLKRVTREIQKLYHEKNRHHVKVDFTIIENKDIPDKASVLFTITEGSQAKIKRVTFKGISKVPDWKLRSFVFTQEDWLLGLLGDSGTYNPDMLEMDKKRIEYFYKDQGYLMARVIDAQVEFSPNKKDIEVTFEIKEGDQYIVRYISAPGDDLFSEDELLPFVTLEVGQPFSQSKMIDSINGVKAQWGNLGYIYADVYPQVVPNEETKEVDITFHAERGKKLYVNRINVTGNRVTKDRVVRREIALEEGDLITSKKLNQSRDGVEYLGFFERGGVNWKTHKLSDSQADLEMNVKETKTGRFNVAMTYGSDEHSSSRLVKGSIELGKSNFMGRGWDVGVQVQGNRKRFQKADLHFFDQHLFDTDIAAGIHLYAKQDEYDQWGNVTPSPLERTVGGSTKIGFLLPWLSRRTQIDFEAGAEYIKNNSPRAVGMPDFKIAYQPVIDRTFQSGDHKWFSMELFKDTRNHKVYPSRGYKLMSSFKTALPGLNKQYSYAKAEIDWSWYTPLIGDDTLVMALHAKGGIVDHLEKDKIIPYKELFHMGGQMTVRGFVWGSIGPAWLNDPVGARKAFQFNAELIFPLIPDYSMKAHVFYDAGAGWDTPKTHLTTQDYLKRDKFNLRHSVGFGVNLVKPFAAKIDWGYKLDRDKKSGESPSEFHISMNMPW